MKYLPGDFKVIKNDFFDPPVVFQLIQQASGAGNREMFEVFNMGHRMDIFTPPAHAETIIHEAEKFGIDAKIMAG
jgi:phosphoribosylformylglycinamidine cyclo-ligase